MREEYYIQWPYRHNQTIFGGNVNTRNFGKILWLLFFIPISAQSAQELRLVYERSSVCSQLTVDVLTQSRHDKGNRNGALNQNNSGFINLCHLPQAEWMQSLQERTGIKITMHALGGGATNSKFGETFMAGFGILFQTPRFYSVALEAGGELPVIWYGEGNQRHDSIWGPLPTRYQGINISIPPLFGLNNIGEFRAGSRRFGFGEKVNLRSYGLTIKVEFR